LANNKRRLFNMDEIIKTLLYQMLGYIIAMGFSFVLFSYWQRGYFTAYLRVRTSLGKLILIKLIGATKITYKVGRVEEGNLLWGKPGKDGHILNDIKRDYIYKEQNVDCVDVDSISYAFIPKEIHYARPLKSLPEGVNLDEYAKVFTKEGNEVIVTGIEGFDPEKVDSLIQRAQFKPSQLNKTVQIILLITVVCLVVSLAAAFAGFIAGDNVKKMDSHLSGVEGKIDQIKVYLTPPNGTILPTGGH
jgi:hypothetical protein